MSFSHVIVGNSFLLCFFARYVFCCVSSHVTFFPCFFYCLFSFSLFTGYVFRFLCCSLFFPSFVWRFLMIDYISILGLFFCVAFHAIKELSQGLRLGILPFSLTYTFWTTVYSHLYVWCYWFVVFSFINIYTAFASLDKYVFKDRKVSNKSNIVLSSNKNVYILKFL